MHIGRGFTFCMTAMILAFFMTFVSTIQLYNNAQDALEMCGNKLKEAVKAKKYDSE